MNTTASLNAKVIRNILARLDELGADIKAIKTKLLEEEPPYGSDAWWEKETKEAEEDFKKGKGIQFKSAKEAIEWLNS